MAIRDYIYVYIYVHIYTHTYIYRGVPHYRAARWFMKNFVLHDSHEPGW